MTFELAQQLCRIWLGNPGEVERTRWKEEWFKEGMATYLAYYFLTQVSRNVKICTSYVSKRQPIKSLSTYFYQFYRHTFMKKKSFFDFLQIRSSGIPCKLYRTIKVYRDIVSYLSIPQREGKGSHNIKMFVTPTFVKAESNTKLLARQHFKL